MMDRKFVKNPWHLVDVFVLVVSWAYIYYPGRFVGVCRALRVLRPMRTVRIFDSVTIVGQCVVDDIVVVRDVMLLTMLLLGAFALIGLTCFHGALQFSCVGKSDMFQVIDQAVLPAGRDSSSEVMGGLLDCPSTLQCTTEQLGEGHAFCKEFSSPRQVGGYMDPLGKRNFDNIFSSMISMVVHMSSDGGMQDMPQALQDAKAASSWLAWPFFAVATVVLR